MKDKDLELFYTSKADEHIKSLDLNGGDAIFYYGVEYGLNLREDEVSELKEQILTLQEQLKNYNN